MLLRSSRDNAFKYIGQPRQWLDVVELRGLDQGRDDRPVSSAAVGKGLIIPWFRQRKLSSGIRFIP